MTHVALIAGTLVLMQVTGCPLFGLVLLFYGFDQLGKAVTRE